MRLFIAQLGIAALCAGAVFVVAPLLTMAALFLGMCANPSYWLVPGLVAWLYLFANYYAHLKLKEADGQAVLSIAAGLIGAPLVFASGLPLSIFLLSSCVN